VKKPQIKIISEKPVKYVDPCVEMDSNKEIPEDMLRMNGYDDCAIGIVEQFGRPEILCYDKRKVIEKLQKEGMTEEEAEEFWSFNQIGAWVGEKTPCFFTSLGSLSAEEPEE